MMNRRTRYVSTWCLLLAGLTCLCRPPAPTAAAGWPAGLLLSVSSITTLKPGEPLVKTMADSEVHSYEVSLAAGQAARIDIRQMGLDVIAVLSELAGTPLAEIDAPDLEHATETVFLVAEQATSFRLEVRQAGKIPPQGSYELRLSTPQPVTPKDRSRFRAQATMTKGDTLRRTGLLADLKTAVTVFNQALALWREGDTPLQEAAALRRLGYVSELTSDYREAQQYYARALTLSEGVGDTPGRAQGIANLGLVHETLGETGDALTHYAEALDLWHRLGERKGLALTLNNLGLLHANLGDLGEALEQYRQALSIFHEIGNLEGEALVLNNLGIVQRKIGDRRKALECYTKGLELRRSIGDRKGEALTTSNLGNLYREGGDYRKALECYTRAQEIRRVLGDRANEGFTFINMGGAYLDLHNEEKSVECYQRAATLFREVGSIRGEADAVYGLACVAAIKQPNEALHKVDEAIALLERFAAGISDQKQRLSYLATRREMYALRVDQLMALHLAHPQAGYNQRAFEAVEQLRQKQGFGAEFITPETSFDPTLTKRKRSLEAQISEKAKFQEHLRVHSASADERIAVAHEIEKLLAEYQEVQSVIRKQASSSTPEYKTLTAENLRKLLPDEQTTLLEYGFGKDRIYLWALSKKESESFDLGPRSDIESAARLFRDAVASLPGRDGAAQTRIETLGASLARMVLWPAARHLTSRRLLIVPDGILRQVPFAALPCAEDHPGDLPIPLVVKYETTFLPSASMMAEWEAKPSQTRNNTTEVAIFADPVFSAKDNRLAADSHRQSAAKADLLSASREVGAMAEGEELPRLPGTRREAIDISRLAASGSVRLALDFNANRDAATSSEVGRFRILHFATHGFVNEVNPELSGVVLSMYDPKGTPRDGFLRAYEIGGLNLSADLVVLSACNTGLGREVRGDGITGLVRGFMHAGGKRVVASLWKVDDQATVVLMTHFYRNMLKSGMTPSAALRAAEVSLLHDPAWRHPYYWAAFQAHGEP